MDIGNLLRCFNDRHVEYVIIGALAMPVHGYFRASRDIDIFIRPTGENARNALKALADAGYDVADLEVETLLTKKVLFRQYALRTDVHPCVLGVDFDGVLERSLCTEIEGVETRVASLDDLIAMKRAAGRPKDMQDLEALERLRDRRG
jgi:predicted nucleotidyltransferase